MVPILEKILKELRRRLEALYGPRLVGLSLYGSQARGEAEAGSDIDVLVILQGPVSPCAEIDRTINDVAELSLDYGVVIACVFVSLEAYKHEQSPLLLNVRQQEITI
ncbi:MAG: nucleotidyltransferase domain-containing protein [Deltaproteobacteria bacterium]|nr:MAG: nucleotidyltransferase domain-containing protein [Deltaproteobacteria bacterium]